MQIHADRSYDVKCTLGTIRDIENLFEKPFFVLAAGLDKLTTTDQIKLLYTGVHRADPSVGLEDFLNACGETMGIGDLADALEEFVLQLQYPGSTKEEIRSKVEKKILAAERFKASTGTKSL